MYSVDTSAFYTVEESELQEKMHRLKQKATELKQFRSEFEKEHERYIELTNEIKNLEKERKEYKQVLKEMILSNTDVRQLKEEALRERNIISAFDSVLTRTLGCEHNQVTMDIIVIETYFFEVLKNLIEYGFEYKTEKYICFTASAGQIRTKKTIFIKEKLFDLHRNSLMCGLTLEKINGSGGININKYLAYLALCNSATDPWNDFNIKKCIVVNDFDLPVHSEVDFIDSDTFEITRKEMDIPIEHTDGCGMILPRKNKKAMMVRLPWVKGLLIPFPFDKFIREHNKNSGYSKYGIVKDIYGVEHDILKENIEVIFTKSQFKMWKYYSSWREYIENYENYRCQAGKCNEEEDHIKNAKTNYQMLQTLTDMSDEELAELSAKTIEKINNIGSHKETMLEVLGVGPWNKSKNYFQQALELYPELLQDTYSKETLKQVKKKIFNHGRSGKLYIDGKYTFISPDLYAFCERLILGENHPQGLLRDGEVFCSIFQDNERLDCLRSPHLFREHAVRTNKIDKEMKRWFVTKSLYTSCHDPISKILQFDVDGDRSLVCRDKLLVEIAERNMKNVVPLYYEMKKASPEIVIQESIYKGLEAAYRGGNIGLVSNDISKMWNSKEIDLDLIKTMVLYNNFVIDYAKTLYKPELPSDINLRKKKYTKNKLPHFFKYAKGKEGEQVESNNGTVVNKLETIIPKTKMKFNATNLGEFNYKILMNKKNISDNGFKQAIIDEYTRNDLKKHTIEFVNLDHARTGDNNPIYINIRNNIAEVGNNDLHYIVDVLVEYLYKHKNSNFKTTLWSCFGDVIVSNIKKNLKDGYVQCQECGKRVQLRGKYTRYCIDCRDKVKREQTKTRLRKYREKNV